MLVQTSLVEDLESQMNIQADERWAPDSPKYKEYLEYSRQREFIRAVENLEGLVVQRILELAKANLASTGKSRFFFFFCSGDSS